MLTVTQIGVLPAWFPAELAFIALLVLILSVLLLNKGRWWSVNMLAMDEPIAVAVGATMAIGSGYLSSAVGAPQSFWIVSGVGIAALGLFAIRSDRIDLDYIG